MTSSPEGAKRADSPPNWYAVDFDDSDWDFATESAAKQVEADGNFVASDLSGAKFIWTSDRPRQHRHLKLSRRKTLKARWNTWNTATELDNICVFTTPAKCPCVSEPAREGQ